MLILIERRLLDLAFEVLYLGTAIYNPRLAVIDWKNIAFLFFFVKILLFVKINKLLFTLIIPGNFLSENRFHILRDHGTDICPQLYQLLDGRGS